MRFAPPSFLRRVLLFVTALTLLVTARAAHAQPVVQGIPSAVLRVEADGKTSADTAHPHAGGVPVNAINYEDCSSNLEYSFPLSLANVTTQYPLVAFAGRQGDCTAAASRTTGSASCFPVMAPLTLTAGATSASVLLRMQDIAAQAASSSLDVSYSAAGPSACVAQPSSSASSLTIYFFFVDANGNAIGVAQAYPVTVDTQAAVVNGSIQALSDNGTLQIQIPGSSDTDITGWNVYCDPPPGQETLINEVPYDAASNQGVCFVDSGSTSEPLDAGADAGDGGDRASLDAGDLDASGDASLDAAQPDAAGFTLPDDAGGNACGVVLNDAGVIPTVGLCYPSGVFATSAVTVVGSSEAGPDLGGLAQSVIPAKYLCGVAGPTDTSVTVSGLKNGFYYNVAVGATDSVGNVGPLATACGQPNPPLDFYTLYMNAGGAAGGGFCATDGVGVPAGTGALFLLVVAAAAALVRRRMRA